MNGALTNRMFKLNLLTRTWTEINHTGGPIARQACSLTAVDSLLYMYGGAAGSTGNQCWSFNPVTRVWNARAVGVSSFHHRTVHYQNQLYAIGGSGPSAAQVVRIYNTVTNSWGIGAAPSAAFYGQGMDLFGDEIWMIGGNSFQTNALARSYSITTDTWTTRGGIGAARSFPTFSNIDSRGYSFGGDPDPGLDRFKRLTLPSTWLQLSDAPVARHTHTANVWNGQMFVIGGIISGASAGTDEVWLYNPG